MMIYYSFLVVLLCLPEATATAKAKITTLNSDKGIDLYPLRRTSEAAVVEWGHSAVISALDAAVASFGPQTSLGAFFEVEAAPILAVPIDGKGGVTLTNDVENVPYPGVLDNAEDVAGNMVVMTNVAGMSGVTMARIAQESGAAALMVVNVMDTSSPDYIYSLSPENDAEKEYAESKIDIPVVMVGLASGNLLTTATVTEGMEEKDVVNNGMPDRVRLYAAGDRPYFEDSSSSDPVVYLIHNMLTEDECEGLKIAAGKDGDGAITKGAKWMQPIDSTNSGPDGLSGLYDNPKAAVGDDESVSVVGVHGRYLWWGALASHTWKQVDERIEQVTGYPHDLLSEWTVLRYDGNGGRQGLRTDSGDTRKPIVTITVFLDDFDGGGEDESATLSKTSGGGEIVFPRGKGKSKLAIRPRLGLAVVHHNIIEYPEADQQKRESSSQTLPPPLLDPNSIHEDLPVIGSKAKYVAVRHVYEFPAHLSRRTVLPVLAMLRGGDLPKIVLKTHTFLVDTFGWVDGSHYFDLLCFIVPLMLLLSILRVVFVMTFGSSSGGKVGSSSTSSNDKKAKKPKKKKKKKAVKEE